MHRLGGLEKKENTGAVSYEPENHQRMVDLRQAKVDKVAEFVPPVEVTGDPDGTADVLLIGWGGTYGSLREATRQLNAQGKRTAHVHLRHLNPFPRNLGTILEHYRGRHIVVAEWNKGQLRQLLRAKYLVDAKGLNKVQGRPFMVSEIVRFVDNLLAPQGAQA
jgi:2-oxoglutarate ferredoxin oxidoreductase subunit alpha